MTGQDSAPCTVHREWYRECSIVVAPTCVGRTEHLVCSLGGDLRSVSNVSNDMGRTRIRIRDHRIASDQLHEGIMLDCLRRAPPLVGWQGVTYTFGQTRCVLDPVIYGKNVSTVWTARNKPRIINNNLE